MDIIESLVDRDKWAEFLEYKLTKSHLNKLEEKQLSSYIIGEKYMPIARSIVDGAYSFSVPTKTLINKSGSSKKRAVYTYTEDENIILKFISFCLYKYDDEFSPVTYAFRRNSTVKQAFITLSHTRGIKNMFSYKIDVSNYFNSIPIPRLLPMLESVLKDDTRLYNLLKSILTEDKAIYNGDVIVESRGVMAGTPISTFLANVYLKDLDWHFYNKGITYARYSDDIIVFSESKDTLDEYKEYILDYLVAHSLIVNLDKVSYTMPNQEWDYLGFSYDNGVIDLSQVTLKKIKDKIRRKARSIYRWRIRKDKTIEHSIRVLIRVFNHKFYKMSNTKDLTWCKWFFPVINTARSLKVIDEYLVMYIRYLTSGRFTKKNYSLTYDKIKSLGYRSLVHEYYKYKDGTFREV